MRYPIYIIIKSGFTSSLDTIKYFKTRAAADSFYDKWKPINEMYLSKAYV